MNRCRLMLVAFMMTWMLAMAQAAQFSMDLYVNDASDLSLVFGLGTEKEISPVPPFFPWTITFYFEGPGDVTTARIDEDFSWLATYIKEETDAALWKMYANDDVKVTFKKMNGSLPNGAVLKIYPEGAENEAIPLVDGTDLFVKAGIMYVIDYRETPTTEIGLACPPVKHAQMNGYKKSLAIDFDVPEGYSLAGDSTVYAFQSMEEDSEFGTYIIFNLLEGNYGSFDAATSTLTMTNMTDVARIQFNYWYTNGILNSEKATVIVDVVKGMSTSLVKVEDIETGENYTDSIIQVTPDNIGYAGTVLTYRIDFDDAMIGQPLTYHVATPKISPIADAYGIQYFFAYNDNASGDYVDMQSEGVAFVSTAKVVFLKIKVVLTNKCESGWVEPTITSSDGMEIAMEKVNMLNMNQYTVIIGGDDAIETGGASTYECFMSCGDVRIQEFTPNWSLSSTTYASVDAAGNVMNKNTTTADQMVTLTAEYTYNGVPKTVTKDITLEKRTLVSIVVNGPVIIASSGVEAYTCTANWSYGDSSQISPNWSLSSTAYASVNETGEVMNQNTTDMDQEVTLMASYTVGDVTKTATKVVTLAKRTLTEIAIDGDATIATGENASYTCSATWSYGDSTVVMPAWSLSVTDYASVDADGKVVNENATDEDKTATLTASYTVGDVTKTATKVITLSKRTLTEITIAGDAVIPAGETATYVCTATWSYGDSTVVMPTWSLSATDYAVVDADGKVMSKNSTDEDQQVMLKASYTIGDVTKTESKVVMLAKRTLTEITIDGDATIATGGTATYVCTATWSYGDSTVVMPTWSLSSTDYAAVDADGKVTNKNATDENQTVTLTANYTSDDVTKTATKVVTLAKRTLTEIAIDGDATIPTAGTANYVCTATWSYGDSTVVIPTWSLSSTDYAAIDADGKVVNENATDENQTVTLTANYTSDDVTKTASKVVALAKRRLMAIAIDGDAVIPTGENVTYTCSATWSYGDSTVVIPTWCLSSTDYASLDADGKVTNKNATDENQTVTLTANYTSDDVMKAATKVITLSKRTLTEIAIDGDVTIPTSGAATYTCTASWSYGDSSVVMPAWSLSSTDYAAVDADGKVVNKNATDEDKTVTLTASYTVGDVTKTASKVVMLAKRTLTEITIDGDATIPTGETTNYVCTATWSYGDSTVVMPTWSLSSTDYAAVDADGKVTNKNATDENQTVTLTANYTSDDVTKTASKVVTLAKRRLMDIAIDGDATIATGENASYTCSATWSYGDSTVVMPTWSLSSTDYAAVDADGKVTNKNATDENQTVTLAANYTSDDVTKTVTKIITLSKRTLKDIAITGDDTIPTAGAATYTCTASWSYGDSTVVTPTWSLSSTDYASVDDDGKVTNMNTTDEEKTVTLIASHTVGDITKTSMKVLTLSKRTLMEIVVNGDETIDSGESATYTCTAVWSYGDSTVVMPTWSLSSTDYASVDADGKVSNQNSTDNDQTVTLTAIYTSNNVTKTATKVITLSKRILMEVVIKGDETINNGESATYTCTAIWSYGESTIVTPVWSLSSTDYAAVDADGKVTNMNRTIDEQTMTLTANYTVGDVTKTATKLIMLIEVTPLILELYPGWNLMTLSKALALDTDGVQKFLSLNPIKCDAGNLSYVFCGNADAIKPGIGYWIYSRNRQSVKLLPDVEKPVSMLNLKPGWNFIGISEMPDWPSSDVVIWAWENNRFKLIDVADMRPGCAYWVYYINQ